MVKKRSNCIDHIYSEKRKSCQLCQSDASKKNPINYAKTWLNLMKGAPPSNHFKTILVILKISQFLILRYKGSVQKKNSGYNEFGTKGGRVSDLNHYFKQL